MDISIWPAMEQPWQEILKTAIHADRTGWNGVFVSDHFMPDGAISGGPRSEAWTSLTAIAARTEQARVGVLVSANTFRHPALVANMASTVDYISAGRFVLGLGAGWQANEHEAYGVELPAPPERLSMLEEACQVLTSLFSKERTNFSGKHYHLVDAPMEPKPLQSPLPLLIGGSGERVLLRIVAQYADHWNSWGMPDVIRARRAVLERHCDVIGRDINEIRISAQVPVFLEEDPSRLRDLRAKEHPLGAAIGPPAQLTEIFAEYSDLGLDEFVLQDRSLAPDAEGRRAVMDRFAAEVAAPFRR
jgi:F420-dependent oxidoreductase-like protein